MSEQMTHTSGQGRRFGAAIKSLIIRLWALTILLIVVWTGYAAIAYLVRSVFEPSEVPPRYTDWPKQITADELRRPQVPGVSAETPRSPISHYHHVERWYESGPAQGCTASGCHGPLPHMSNKRLRSFANSHSSFMTCRLCHDRAIDGPVEAYWHWGRDQGQREGVPAVLLLNKYLKDERDLIRDKPAEAQGRMLELLAEAVRVAGGDPVLDYLRIQIDTTQPGSPVWRDAVARLRQEVPRHVAGEYGARIAPRQVADSAWPSEGKLFNLAREYHEAEKGSDARMTLWNTIHEPVESGPSACLSCHGGQPQRIDLVELGFTGQRAQYLSGSLLARMIANLKEGEQFYLPRILETQSAP